MLISYANKFNNTHALLLNSETKKLLNHVLAGNLSSRKAMDLVATKAIKLVRRGPKGATLEGVYLSHGALPKSETWLNGTS